MVAVEEQAGIRDLLKPEWIILLCAILVTFGLMWRTSSGEEEYPQPGERTDLIARTGLKREAERLLDARPVGCF